LRNLWGKKNPLMSLWLSGANSVLGSARSRVAAEAKRNTTIMMQEATKQWLRLWTGGLAGPRPRRRRKSR